MKRIYLIGASFAVMSLSGCGYFRWDGPAEAPPRVGSTERFDPALPLDRQGQIDSQHAPKPFLYDAR